MAKRTDPMAQLTKGWAPEERAAFTEFAAGLDGEQLDVLADLLTSVDDLEDQRIPGLFLAWREVIGSVPVESCRAALAATAGLPIGQRTYVATTLVVNETGPPLGPLSIAMLVPALRGIKRADDQIAVRNAISDLPDGLAAQVLTVAADVASPARVEATRLLARAALAPTFDAWTRLLTRGDLDIEAALSVEQAVAGADPGLAAAVVDAIAQCDPSTWIATSANLVEFDAETVAAWRSAVSRSKTDFHRRLLGEFGVELAAAAAKQLSGHDWSSVMTALGFVVRDGRCSAAGLDAQETGYLASAVPPFPKLESRDPAQNKRLVDEFVPQQQQALGERIDGMLGDPWLDTLDARTRQRFEQLPSSIWRTTTSKDTRKVMAAVVGALRDDSGLVHLARLVRNTRWSERSRVFGTLNGFGDSVQDALPELLRCREAGLKPFGPRAVAWSTMAMAMPVDERAATFEATREFSSSTIVAIARTAAVHDFGAIVERLGNLSDSDRAVASGALVPVAGISAIQRSDDRLAGRVLALAESGEVRPLVLLDGASIIRGVSDSGTFESFVALVRTTNGDLDMGAIIPALALRNIDSPDRLVAAADALGAFAAHCSASDPRPIQAVSERAETSVLRSLTEYVRERPAEASERLRRVAADDQSSIDAFIAGIPVSIAERTALRDEGGTISNATRPPGRSTSSARQR